MEIRDILKPEEIAALTFTKKEQEWLNKRIKTRRDGKPGVECIVRGMNTDGDYFELKPEEVVRQLYAYRLINKYGYPKDSLEFEVPAMFAGKSAMYEKRIDIAVYSDATKKNFDVIIEVKRPEIDNENVAESGETTTPKQQMQSYCKNKNAKVGVIANGARLLKYYLAPYFNDEISIDRFPKFGEEIDEWKDNQRFTLKQLMQNDRLQTETLKDIILAVEQRFGANDSSDKAFEEIFKLIFTKLYDEKMASRDADDISRDMRRHGLSLSEIDDRDFRLLEFRVKGGESPEDTYARINELFNDAKEKWPGVFSQDAVLDMQPTTVKSCVRELQNVKLFNSNLEVIDDAFEHLVNRNQKDDMGQFFTPRYVIDMCVKMLNPKSTEKMIDTAAGSCGFPMHTTFQVWKTLNPDADNLFTTQERKPEETKFVQNNVFGIDFSENSVRVGRMLNIIAGDGQTNVIYLNTLDYLKWDDWAAREEWDAKYHDGFIKLKKMEVSKDTAKKYPSYYPKWAAHKYFSFDILMANPPFAGDLDNAEQIEPYTLSHKNGKLQKKVDREILFIERNLNFLKPGGRMAIVLPQGRMNNSSDKYIREYILSQCRLLAVVGVHGNAFKNGKNGTGTKTSVLFVQKWTDDKCGYPNICPKPQADEDGNIDYPIFFATMQEPSKDNSGDKIYVTETYVSWKSYSYETLEVITRKSDDTILSRDEYEKLVDKSNYNKSKEPAAYIRKSDGVTVDKATYEGASKKSDYKKVYEYTRISDGVVLSEEEYKETTKTSNYKITIYTNTDVTEHTDNNGSTRFIKDLFVQSEGSLDSHKKWIKKNVRFELKNKTTNLAAGFTEFLTIEEYFALSDSDKSNYKEIPVLGVNSNTIIGLSEYELLTPEEKKYYLPSEDVTEYTERVKDTHGHIFVKHDLFNHDPNLENANPNNVYSQNGIAEAFAKFAFDQKLSFAPTEEELEEILHPENELPF